MPLLLVSFAIGLCLGAIYDVFRIRRVALRLAVGRPTAEKGLRAFVCRHLWKIDGWLCFGEDVLFFLFGTVVFILADFKLYFGIPRWYAYGAALAGAVLYRVTLGRLVMGVSEQLIRFVVRVLRLVRDRMILPLGKAVGRRVNALGKEIRRKRELAFTEAQEMAVLSALERLGEG